MESCTRTILFILLSVMIVGVICVEKVNTSQQDTAASAEFVSSPHSFLKYLQVGAVADALYNLAREVFALENGKLPAEFSRPLQELKKTLDTKPVTERYDFVLDVKPVETLMKSGWKLEFKDKEMFDAVHSATSLPYIFAVSGSRFNVGKTWLISYLMGKNYGFGVLDEHVTRGLSFIWDKVMIIDSMGQDRPFVGISQQQRVVMDRIVQDFLMRVAQTYIYVVGVLGASDIENVNQLVSRLQTVVGEGGKVIERIFIVHNFITFASVDEVEKHIQDDIVSAFNAEADQLSPGLWRSHKNSVMHVVFARQNTPAGLVFNERSRNVLLGQITAVAPLQNIKVLDVITSTTNSLLHQYLYMPDQAKKLIPVTFDLISHQIGATRRGFIFRPLVVAYEQLSGGVASVFSFFAQQFGLVSENTEAPTAPTDPFELKLEKVNEILQMMQFNSSSISESLLYSPLDPCLQLDKTFPVKIDDIDNGKCRLLTFDLPGVEGITADCSLTNELIVTAARTIPPIYDTYLKQVSDIKRNERRFNTFHIQFPFEKSHHCNSKTLHYRGGVLYILVPAVDNRSKPHTCSAILVDKLPEGVIQAP